MEILTLLATIVGASIAALKPENIVASAIGGIVGNRVDAAFMVGYESVVDTFKKTNNSVDWELQKAIRRSLLLALQSIAVECQKELLGMFPQQYRGQPVYSQYQSDLKWLDAKLKNLAQELKDLEKVKESSFTTYSISNIETLMRPEGQNAAIVIQTVRQNLLNEALKDGSISIYEIKVKQDRTGLFERVCAYFTSELKNNHAVSVVFEGQLLAQINASVVGQELTLRNLESALQSLAKDTPQILLQLDVLELVIEQGNSQLDQHIDQGFNTVIKSLEEIKAQIAQHSGLPIFPDSSIPLSGYERQNPTIDNSIGSYIEGTEHPIADNIPSSLISSRSGSAIHPPRLSLPVKDFVFKVIILDRQGNKIVEQSKQGYSFTETLSRKSALEMVYIPEGSFLIGSLKKEAGHRPNEAPQCLITIEHFLISQTPITQAQWKAIKALPKINQNLPLNPSKHKGVDRPVDSVSWHDAVEFCNRLSKLTGRNYRLPTEAEWEYACRAGTQTPFHFGETISSEVANYDGSFKYGSGLKGKNRQETTLVKYFQYANAFGLFDMHGNVWEWCLDQSHDTYDGIPVDGSAWLTNDQDQTRMLRGGSWYNDPMGCRSASRLRWKADEKIARFGFRVAYSDI